MASSRVARWWMSKPWMTISNGTVRTLGEKLNRPVLLAPTHSPTSLAFASEAANATMRMGCCTCTEMYRMRLTTASRVGPTSLSRRCSSSTMKRRTSCTVLRVFHRRLMRSHFSGVVITMFDSSSVFTSIVVSPTSSATLKPSVLPNLYCHSCRRSLAVDGCGATYTQRLMGSSPRSMRSTANSAQTTFPLAAGAQMRQLSFVEYSVLNVCV
mmetsp:Transcript_19882/g.59476  ORF Transcript_19882/g.59476 Transcript_19882/m.59476 type:complete len:212 (-) Transcript_19882:3463-4098(-)